MAVDRRPHVELSIKLLEHPTNMAAGFPQNK
jgi:hypothetical protein